MGQPIPTHTMDPDADPDMQDNITLGKSFPRSERRQGLTVTLAVSPEKSDAAPTGTKRARVSTSAPRTYSKRQRVAAASSKSKAAEPTDQHGEVCGGPLLFPSCYLTCRNQAEPLAADDHPLDSRDPKLPWFIPDPPPAESTSKAMLPPPRPHKPSKASTGPPTPSWQLVAAYDPAPASRTALLDEKKELRRRRKRLQAELEQVDRELAICNGQLRAMKPPKADEEERAGLRSGSPELGTF